MAVTGRAAVAEILHTERTRSIAPALNLSSAPEVLTMRKASLTLGTVRTQPYLLANCWGLGPRRVAKPTRSSPTAVERPLPVQRSQAAAENARTAP